MITIYPGANELPGDYYPAGNDKSIQFNDNGFPGASANLVWDSPNIILGVGPTAPAAWAAFGQVLISGNPAGINFYNTTGAGNINWVLSETVGGVEAYMQYNQTLHSWNFQTAGTGFYYWNVGGVEKARIDTNSLSVQVPVKLKGYTVATLPAGVVGKLAYCTDLLAPANLAAVVGGGAVTGPVFYDGANWISL